jgi:hypothetical protein
VTYSNIGSNRETIMTTETIAKPLDTNPQVSTSASADEPIIALKRRSIDKVLVAFGLVATVVFVVAGALLSWGYSFSDDYVTRELSSQNITFPSAEELTDEGRTDLLEWAGEPLTTGKGAEAYASYIDGHLEGIADGLTYAELGAVERAAKGAVTAATDAGAPQAEIDELQATADGVTGQRNSLFKGETLRGLLLSAYAWSTVGTIAGIAAIGAFIAAAIMAVLTALGVVHYRKAATH